MKETSQERQAKIGQDFVKYNKRKMEKMDRDGRLEPEDTIKHPLDDFATIEQKFTTPFMDCDTFLPEKMRTDLINVLIQKETAMSHLKTQAPKFYSLAEAKGFYATTHYNLFSETELEKFPNERESILGYRDIAMQQILYYIRKGWGIQQADEMKIEGRCFGNIQEHGGRTYPHYHQDMNGVLVSYLRMGDEDVSYEDQINVGYGSTSRSGTHQILFQDPRPSINYPFWEKIYSITPRVGKTIIHPNYVWHETTPWLGKGTRVSIVVNFRIMSHGYNEISEVMYDPQEHSDIRFNKPIDLNELVEALNNG